MRFDYQTVIDKYYPAGTRLRDIYMRHCRSVADKALEIARRRSLPLDEEEIEAAAMLHDIGISLTDAAGIECRGSLPYLAHGYAGADLLRREGAPETYARVAERHTGSGLSPEEAALLPSPPGRSYMPETLLERLVCYADKFYSKSGDMAEKPIERVRASIAKFGPAAASRFETLREEFS